MNVSDATSSVGGLVMMPLLWCASPMYRDIFVESI